MQKRNGWKEMEHAATPSHLHAFAEKFSALFGEIHQIHESDCPSHFKQDKYGANSESMLALSVRPEAIASGFASSVGGPEMAVENGREGFHGISSRKGGILVGSCCFSFKISCGSCGLYHFALSFFDFFETLTTLNMI